MLLGSSDFHESRPREGRTFLRAVNASTCVPWERVTYWKAESSWNVMVHGDAREGKWRGNWRMEWVASTLHTTSEHGVSSITTADPHTSAASSRLNWPLRRFNGLVRFAERRNLVSARVPAHFKCSLKNALVKYVHYVTSLSSVLLWYFPNTSRRMKSKS